MNRLREDTKRLSSKSVEILQGKPSASEKMRHDKLASQLKQQLMKFEKLCEIVGGGSGNSNAGNVRYC